MGVTKSWTQLSAPPESPSRARCGTGRAAGSPGALGSQGAPARTLRPAPHRL